MMDNKKYSEEWKEFLISELKACAKVLDDNAEEIIGKYVFTGDLDIMITIDTSHCEEKYPKISISKDYFPDYKLIEDAYGEFRHKRREQIVKEKIEDILKRQDEKETREELCGIYSDDDCGDSK